MWCNHCGTTKWCPLHVYTARMWSRSASVVRVLRMYNAHAAQPFLRLTASRYVQLWFLNLGACELILKWGLVSSFFFFFLWSGGLWNWNFVNFHFEAKFELLELKLQCFLQILFWFWSEKCNVLLKIGSRGLDYISTVGLENWHVPQLGGLCKLQKGLKRVSSWLHAYIPPSNAHYQMDLKQSQL